MKKIAFLLCFTFCLGVLVVKAQVPNQFNYQAVARNTLGQAIPNVNINTKFTILDGSATGVNVYSEVRSLTTNQLGLFTAAIGGPGATTVTGNFATIDWSTGKKFIKVEVDPLGGNNFIALGNTEMLSVPYALYAVNGKVGPQGPPNVLNVGTVITGATGTAASATITGTSPAQTINLVLPTGANGKISLVKTSTEPAGANCTVGGTKIEAGVDNNSNSTLDVTEVTNISYVCNGDVNNAWKLSGNASTTPTDFIGTTDNKDFTIKTNNVEAIKVLANGNVGIGTPTPGSKLSIEGSVAQPIVNVHNNNASAFSYGTHSFSENGVGVFAQSLNGKALVGFTNSTTQPAAEFTNNVGAGVKITNNAATKPALDVINNGTNFLSYGINSFSQGGIGVFGQSVAGNGVVGFNSSATQPTAKFTNTTGAALSVNGGVSYKAKIVTADYTLTDNDHIIFCDLEANAGKKITVTLPTPTAAREGREFVINVIRAQTLLENNLNTRPGGFVQINGVFGDPAGENYPTASFRNKLYIIRDIGIIDDFTTRRTIISYICINNKWYTSQDNYYADSD